jgi:Domain of unknown function (DUF4136)
MSRVRKHLAAPLLGVGLLLVACHPSGAEYISDLDTVATTHDAAFDFATPTTYSLPDRVVFITDSDPGGNPDRLPPDLEQLILTTIQNEMNALGYQQVDIGANPDLTMTVGALKVENVSYYYGYWCGYWSWYYPCYPYYPPVVGVSTYTVGTLIIDIAPNALDTGNQYEGVWTAVIRGVQTGSNSTDRTRLVNGISQAYIQSPYLGKP